MEAPKCKYCGKVEWKHVCASMRLLMRVAPEAIGIMPLAKIKPGGFDKVAYQRDYMRERRAMERERVPPRPRGRPKKVMGGE